MNAPLSPLLPCWWITQQRARTLTPVHASTCGLASGQDSLHWSLRCQRQFGLWYRSPTPGTLCAFIFSTFCVCMRLCSLPAGITCPGPGFRPAGLAQSCMTETSASIWGQASKACGSGVACSWLNGCWPPSRIRCLIFLYQPRGSNFEVYAPSLTKYGSPLFINASMHNALPCRFATSDWGHSWLQTTARARGIGPAMDLRVYGVTDPACNAKQGRSNAEAVRAAIAGGMTLVQLREKDADGGNFCREARAVLEVARPKGVSQPSSCWPAMAVMHVEFICCADGQHTVGRSIPMPKEQQTAGTYI